MIRFWLCRVFTGVADRLLIAQLGVGLAASWNSRATWMWGPLVAMTVLLSGDTTQDGATLCDVASSASGMPTKAQRFRERRVARKQTSKVIWISVANLFGRGRP